ncbi:MAG: hypothetical protein ACOC05_09040 [Oceanicaulis sp.]
MTKDRGATRNMTIRTARTEDLAAVDTIARSLTLGREDSRDSFLVPHFSRSDYETFLKHKDVTFLVATGEADTPQAFLAA